MDPTAFCVGVTATLVRVNPDSPDQGSVEQGETPDLLSGVPRRGRMVGWLRRVNGNDRTIDVIRRLRQRLPGDPEFGDPLSTAGEGGPQAAARVTDRLIRDRDAASREVSLGVLQVWQALTEWASGRPANPEATLVFTDLVGFSNWSLKAGDEATLTLLRRVAQAMEPPLLDAGGRIVKRMGDGMMAVFGEPLVAVFAVLAAQDALTTVQVDGYVPRMRAGIHTGHPQRLADDWLGIDVNIAARVMERATKGGIVVSGTTLERIEPVDLAALGVVARRLRKPMFGPKLAGVPEDLAMYRLVARPEPSGGDGQARAGS